MVPSSRRSFAKSLGVSEGAVRKALATGRIVAMPDGLIDLDSQRVAWEKNRAELRPPRAPKASRAEEDRSDADIDGIDSVDIDGIDGGELLKARIFKERAIGKTKDLEYRRLRGTLVEKTIVKKVFFEHSRQFRDAILNMPSRLGSVQAAAITQYLKSVLAGSLTDAQMVEIEPQLSPKAVESIVTDTMTGELRAILEGMADSTPPSIA